MATGQRSTEQRNDFRNKQKRLRHAINKKGKRPEQAFLEIIGEYYEQ